MLLQPLLLLLPLLLPPLLRKVDSSFFLFYADTFQAHRLVVTSKRSQEAVSLCH